MMQMRQFQSQTHVFPWEVSLRLRKAMALWALWATF